MTQDTTPALPPTISAAQIRQWANECGISVGRSDGSPYANVQELRTFADKAVAYALQAIAAGRAAREPTADWANRRTDSIDGWINELMTLADHPGQIPTFARNAMRTIARGIYYLAAPRAEAVAQTRASAVAVPAGFKLTKIDRGFRWDGDALHHVPNLLIEFEPVPANSSNTAKGWEDRDALAELLAASPECATAPEPAAAPEAAQMVGEPKVPRIVATAPARIYLHINGGIHEEGDDFREIDMSDSEAVTWSRDNECEVCVPYIRADIRSGQ